VLGVDPRLAVTVNLAYSAVAAVMFGWAAMRVVRLWRIARRSEPVT
jgi:hypothetical protein